MYNIVQFVETYICLLVFYYTGKGAGDDATCWASVLCRDGEAFFATGIARTEAEVHFEERRERVCWKCGLENGNWEEGRQRRAYPINLMTRCEGSAHKFTKHLWRVKYVFAMNFWVHHATRMGRMMW